MKAKDVIQLLGIAQGTWNCYIADGIVAKMPQGEYEPHSVFSQIMRHKEKLYKDATRRLAGANTKITHLERKLAAEKAMPIQRPKKSGKTDSPDEQTEVEYIEPKTRKEKMEVELAKRRVRKMDMDEKIRTKKHIPVELMCEVVTDLAVVTANKIKPIPMMIKRHIPDLPAVTYERVVKDITSLSNELAEYQAGSVVDRFIEDYEPKGFFDDDE